MLINHIDHAKIYMTLLVLKTFIGIISVINYTKQYSRRSCLVISGVELPRNKTSENAKETETKVG